MVLIIIIVDVMYMAKRKHSCVPSAVSHFLQMLTCRSTCDRKMDRQLRVINVAYVLLRNPL